MYLLYFYRGTLKLKHGKMVISSFVSDEVNDYRHTMIPKQPLTVEHGKIWCESELEIPLAATILLAHREKYVKEMQDKWTRKYGFKTDVPSDILDKIDKIREDIEGTNQIRERMIEKMPPKKKTDYINETPKAPAFEDLVFTEEELRYLKTRIREDIIMIESKKTNSSYGRGYKDMCATEKARWDRDLEISYEIFDKLLMMGIKED